MIVAFISSVFDTTRLQETDFVLKKGDEGFTETGLKVTSVFKMDKLATIDKRIIQGNTPREARFRKSEDSTKAEDVKRKEIKSIDLLELFGRMLAALEKPYGSVAPQSNREQFRKIRRDIDTEKVPEAIYWLHHFEQAQVNVIGRERLEKTTCHKILETPYGGILLIMLEDFFDQNCEEHRTLQNEIHQYLKLDALHRQYVKLPTIDF